MSELLKINVNDHTEKKGGLTYLSWAWAWAEVLKVDPKATWTVQHYGQPGEERPCMWVGDTAMVSTLVTINGLTRECLLPVMDNRNNAVKNPDARKISDAIMRCMTKAIAMHGLGLYIYAGEDLPETDDADSLVPVLEASVAAVEQAKTGALAAAAADAGKALDAPTKTALAKLAFELGELFKREDGAAMAFTRIEMDELNNDEKTYLWGMLDSKLRSALKREGQTRALKEHA